MDIDFFRIFCNTSLVCAVISWLIAQVLKTIIYTVTNKTFNIKRLVGDGGMPSGHSATVTALAVSVGIEYGLDSPIFAVAFIVAIIVMHDAMGVRREAGRHAAMLNSIAEEFQRMANPNIAPEIKLKEFLGHTPLQVIFGSLLGFLVAVIFNLIR